MKYQDCDMWERFVDGDESAFKEIFDGYYDLLINYGAKFTPDVHLLDDAIQNLFIKLWQNRRNLKKPASLKHYLFKALRNTIINLLQSEARTQRIDITGGNYQFSLEPNREEKIILSEEEMGQRRILDQKIQRLTNRQREGIYLRFFQELSYEEIAGILNMDIGGAYKLIHRALKRLRE